MNLGIIGILTVVSGATLLLLTAANIPNAFSGGGGSRDSTSQVCDEPTCGISISGATFVPGTLHVQPNSAVTWTNMDKMVHTVTSGSPGDEYSGAIFDSGIPMMLQGEKWQHHFNATSAGTYEYYCQAHPAMAGAIIVEGEVVPEFPALGLTLLVAGVIGSLLAITRISAHRARLRR